MLSVKYHIFLKYVGVMRITFRRAYIQSLGAICRCTVNQTSVIKRTVLWYTYDLAELRK